MCGGFTCSKNTLLGLNIVYVMVAFLLIGVATYGKTSNMVTSLPLLGGIVASGVFLLFVAILGLVATLKHNQVWLFLYMAILFIIFVIQFSVACACIGFDKDREIKVIERGWDLLKSDKAAIISVERAFGCCGLKGNVTEYIADCQQHVEECGKKGTLTCPTCLDKIDDKVDYAFSASGGVGLFFSFVEVIGVVVAYRYRNMARPPAPGELFQ